MATDDVWVIVPVFNEAAAVSRVVTELRVAFANVLCVDDGSTDGSAELARAAGATVLRHAVNLGQGAALQTAFEYLRRVPGASYAITFDADGQHLVSDAVAMLDRARRDDLDVVLASRFSGSTERMPRSRELVLKGAVWFTRLASKLDVTDAHNGLRVLGRRVFTEIDLQHPRMAYASELIHQIAHRSMSFGEEPTTVIYTDYSRAKGQRNLNAVNILFDLALARVRSQT